MQTYQAVLFSSDGEYVTDFKGCRTKQEVWDKIADMGSRWVFYPICCVGTDISIVDAPDCFEFLKGLRIKNAVKSIKEDQKFITELLSY